MAAPLLKKASASGRRGGKAALCSLAAASGLAGTLLLYARNIPSPGFVRMADAQYGNPWLFMATALCGTVFLTALALLLDTAFGERQPRLLAYMGKNTLCVFAVQKPVIKLFAAVFSRVRLPEAAALIITLAGTALLSCLACAVINYVLPLLAGKAGKNGVLV